MLAGADLTNSYATINRRLLGLKARTLIVPYKQKSVGVSFTGHRENVNRSESLSVKQKYKKQTTKLLALRAYKKREIVQSTPG